ncbi:MAG: hypothetical protein IKZ83_03865 [Prevotella sp.]|nr:hypothetical protein [Prevotella sp.]
MRKLLLLLFLPAFIEADAQFFNGRSALEQWRDSVMHSVRLTPIVSLKNLSFSRVGNTPERSIMFQNRPIEQSISPTSVQIGRFVVCDPPPIFQYNHRYFDDDQTILGALLDTFVDILIDNSSKPKSKPSKKTIDY